MGRNGSRLAGSQVLIRVSSYPDEPRLKFVLNACWVVYRVVAHVLIRRLRRCAQMSKNKTLQLETGTAEVQ
jgi:hypothetical protein